MKTKDRNADPRLGRGKHAKVQAAHHHQRQRSRVGAEFDRPWPADELSRSCPANADGNYPARGPALARARIIRHRRKAGLTADWVGAVSAS
jgi:hypothetical protein